LSAEASLIQSAPATRPIMSLMRADLSGIDLSDEARGAAEPYAAAPSARDPGPNAPDGASPPIDAGVPVLDLSSADLTYADLRYADLDSTVLHDANLSGANLSGVEGTTGERLEEQASSLQGAVVPNGQKYEDWLNNKGG
jgi:uncharacterized protein YjbI with pentapeptide repeats